MLVGVLHLGSASAQEEPRRPQPAERRIGPQPTDPGQIVPAPPSPARPTGSATPPLGTPQAAAGTTCEPAAIDAGGAPGLAAADINRDGRVSRSEFMKFHETLFDGMPKDQGGQVSLGGAHRPRTGAGRTERGTPPPDERSDIADRRDDADAASSSRSAPASTPSSTAPQEAKPGRR